MLYCKKKQADNDNFQVKVNQMCLTLLNWRRCRFLEAEQELCCITAVFLCVFVWYLLFQEAFICRAYVQKQSYNIILQLHTIIHKTLYFYGV